MLSFSAVTEDTICIGLARVGSENQDIKVATLKDMASVDLGGPLHSLIIAGHMHPLEMDMLKIFANDATVLDKLISDK